MANLSATISALNSMLASQERRLQTDVQASLAAMDLGLKERSRKDLKEFRSRTLEDEDAKIRIMEKEQRDTRMKNKADQFYKNVKEIQDVISMQKIEFANDIWSGMFSATYDKIVGGTTKIEKSHYKKMYAYLSGDDVGFSLADAKKIGNSILSYGSWTAEQGGKPSKIMVSLARYMGNRMADPQTKAGFSFAAFNAGMAPDPRDNTKSGILNQHNNMVFYGKARELDAMQRDLDREIEELSFTSSKGTEEERYEEENRIKYDFNSASTQRRNNYTKRENEEKDDPERGLSTIIPELKNITTQSRTPITETSIAYKKTKEMMERRKIGDYSYRNEQGFLNLNPYFQGTYDASGNLTGVNVQRMGGENFDEPMGAINYELKSDRRLQWNEDEQYAFLEEGMNELGRQIEDTRNTIAKLNEDMSLIAENAQREGVSVLIDVYKNKEISRFREEERLAFLEQHQTELYDQVANWTFEDRNEFGIGGVRENQLRKMLPGKYLSEPERFERKENVKLWGENHFPEPLRKPEMGVSNVYDYIGGSVYDSLEETKARNEFLAINPNIVPWKEAKDSLEEAKVRNEFLSINPDTVPWKEAKDI